MSGSFRNLPLGDVIASAASCPTARLLLAPVLRCATKLEHGRRRRHDLHRDRRPAADGTTFIAIGGLPPSEALVRDNHP